MEMYYEATKDLVVTEKGWRLQVYPDDVQDSPLDWDDMIKWVLLHNRYNLKNSLDIKAQHFDGWDEMEEYLQEEYDPGVMTPVYMLDHSGLALSTDGFSCPWDSGQIGWAFISKEDLEKEYDGDDNRAMKYIQGCLETYQQYLNGEVYCMILSKNGEVVESIGGFYGSDFKESGMKDYLTDYVSPELADELLDNLEWHY